jgi:hypothetical protein
MADTGGLTRVPRAVAHDCGVCGRRMGRTATRLLNEGRPIYCGRCGLDRTVHAVTHPECSVPGHLPIDHQPGHRGRGFRPSCGCGPGTVSTTCPALYVKPDSREAATQ